MQKIEIIHKLNGGLMSHTCTVTRIAGVVQMHKHFKKQTGAQAHSVYIYTCDVRSNVFTHAM